MAQKIFDQIEKLMAELRVEMSGASPNEIKLNKKKAELAELECKVSSKTPDKDDEKKAKLREQIAKLEAPKPKKEAKKETEKPKEVKEESETEKPKNSEKPKKEKDTRVIKLTGPLLESFKKAMEEAGLDANAESKKSFTVYANSLSSDEYAANKLEVHMKNFASRPTVVTVDELHKMNEDLEEVSAGLFRNKKSKKLLTGPPEEDDEEFDDAKFEGKEYVLGQTTKRVYKSSPDGPDVFVGYWSVGKFYDADM